MKKSIFALSALLSFFFTFSVNAQESLLWEIKSPKNGVKSYLFGTYHLVGSTYLESHTKVQNAYKGAKTVVVEMVLDSTKLMQFAQAGMMTTSLTTLVDSTDYHLIKSNIEPIMGMDMTFLNMLKPVSLSAMYAVHLAEKNAPVDFKYEGMPIDLYFAVDGKKKAKEIVALEDMMEQARILYDSDPVEKQAEDLVNMLRDTAEAMDVTAQLIEAYQKEDLDAMAELGREWSAEYGDMTALLDDRNLNWMPTLKNVFNKGNAFVAVGALHLPGDAGLLSLLREAGYSVKPVKN